MARVLLTRSFSFLALATLLFASSASADPIVVTSGQFVVPDDDADFFQFFGADGFVLGGLFSVLQSSPFLTCIPGCSAGTVVNLSTVAGGTSPFTRFTLGQATGAVIDGRVFLPPFGLRADSPRLVGTFRFDAPAVVVPPPVDAAASGVNLTGPFVFHGDVTGFAPEDATASVPLFHVDLVGQGTANLSLSFFGAEENQLFYTFSATPEPASLLLFVTGLAGLAAKRGRRRR